MQRWFPCYAARHTVGPTLKLNFGHGYVFIWYAYFMACNACVEIGCKV